MSVFYSITRSHGSLTIQMPAFYPIARSYGNLAMQMSEFYSIARSYENLATQMSVFYPIARSYGNLTIQTSPFYPTARSQDHLVGRFRMIAANRWILFLPVVEVDSNFRIIKVLKCDHCNENYRATFPYDAVWFLIFQVGLELRRSLE